MKLKAGDIILIDLEAAQKNRLLAACPSCDFRLPEEERVAFLRNIAEAEWRVAARQNSQISCPFCGYCRRTKAGSISVVTSSPIIVHGSGHVAWRISRSMLRLRREVADEGAGDTT